MRDWEDYIRELEESANEARSEELRLRQLIAEHGLCPDDDDGDHLWTQPDPEAGLECLNCKQTETEIKGE